MILLSMKRSILFIVIILFAGYNFFCCNEKKMSELVLANVEALAKIESSDESSTHPCISVGKGCLDGKYWFPYMRESW